MVQGDLDSANESFDHMVRINPDSSWCISEVDEGKTIRIVRSHTRPGARLKAHFGGRRGHPPHESSEPVVPKTRVSETYIIWLVEAWTEEDGGKWICVGRHGSLTAARQSTSFFKQSFSTSNMDFRIRQCTVAVTASNVVWDKFMDKGELAAFAEGEEQ